MNPIRITIIDDHVFVRQGIETLLKSVFPEAVLTSFDRIPASHFITEMKADLIVCDYRVGNDHALTLLHAVSGNPTPPPVLVISMLEEANIAPSCITAGASGFVSKSAPSDDFISAVKTLLAGRIYLSTHATKAALTNPESAPCSITRQLSLRELQIFSVLGEGLSVSIIASRLGISVKTVESHRENIKNKLNLHTASEVVIAASKWLSSGS
jgi:two-component system, NarL family, invasion response regulator UvrY